MKVLNLQNVSLVRNGSHILKGINWQIEEGQHWAIVGANGSGKTVLLKTITGYIWPTSGTVEVLGKKFGEVDLRELRKQIGWVSFDLQQRIQESTAKEVVISGYYASIGLYEHPTPGVGYKADALLKLVGLDALAERPFHLLSYGEQKRVLIARSLMHEPKLLILDEPCSGLDLKAREEFLEFLEGISSKQTIILVTHHIEEIIPSITHVLCLKKGEAVTEGPKEEVLNDKTIQDVLGVALHINRNGERYTIEVQ